MLNDLIAIRADLAIVQDRLGKLITTLEAHGYEIAADKADPTRFIAAHKASYRRQSATPDYTELDDCE